MSPEQILFYIKSKIKKEWVICFLAAMVIGIAVHIYKLTNFIPNWDSLLNYYTNQDKVNLGRCFLIYACSLSSYYDLPWVNGLLSLIYIAGSAVCISELFYIKNKIPLILIGGIMVSFPTVTSTLAYNYTADGYFLALFCMCLAVVLIVKRKKIFFPAILIAFGTGVYQAYVTFAMLLMLIYLIDQLLFQRVTQKKFWKITGNFAISGVLGCLGYIFVLKVILFFSNTNLSEYQNINESFSLQGTRFFYAMLRCGYKFLMYFFDFSKGINLFLILNIILVLLLTALFIYSFYVQETAKEPWRLLFIIVCAAMIPFVSYALYFINQIIDYHNLMVMCLSLIYILPVLFYEHLQKNSDSFSIIGQWIIIGVSIFILYDFSLVANISYQKMELAYEKSYGIIIRLADRIEQMPKAKECKKIAVFGCLPDSEKISVNFPPDMTGVTDSYILRKQDAMMHENVTQAMLNDYCGFDYKDTTKEEIEEIRKKKEFCKMGYWPERNSIAVIDDILVIQFGDENNE